MGVFPFVLSKEATNIHALFHQAVVAQRVVFNAVVAIFGPHNKTRRHEPQTVEIVHILRTSNVIDVMRKVIGSLCLIVGLRIGQRLLLVGGQRSGIVFAHIEVKTQFIGFVQGLKSIGSSGQFAQSAVITLTVNVLKRGISTEMSLTIKAKEVVAQASAVDGMFDLFGNIGLVSRQVKFVSATSILLQAVVFKGYFGVIGESEERAKPHSFII